MSETSHDILVYNAESLIGTWLVKELMRRQGPSASPKTAAGPPEVPRIYATVFSSRSRRSHELFTLGAQVIEMSPSNKSRLEEVIKKVKGVVVIPPLENRAEWDKEMECAIECISKANPNVVIYLSSVYGSSERGGQELGARGYEKGKEILDKLEKVEKKFQDVGKNKKWAILRTTFIQEFLLHYSRLIQETGTLLLPIEKAKCSYLSLSDVGSCVWKLISQPSSFNIYTLTGPESISGEDIVRKINQSVEAKVSFKPIDTPFARRYLRYELGEQAIALVDYYLVMLCLLKDGKLDFTTDDVKKIVGREPEKLDVMFKEYSQLFRP